MDLGINLTCFNKSTYIPEEEEDEDQEAIRRRMVKMIFHNALPSPTVLNNHKVFSSLEKGLDEKQRDWLKNKRDDILDGFLDESDKN